jgi:hypothetical protein
MRSLSLNLKVPSYFSPLRALKDDSGLTINQTREKCAPRCPLSLGHFVGLDERQKILVHAPRECLTVIILFVFHERLDHHQVTISQPRRAFAQNTANLKGIGVEKAGRPVVALDIAEHWYLATGRKRW